MPIIVIFSSPTYFVEISKHYLKKYFAFIVDRFIVEWYFVLNFVGWALKRMEKEHSQFFIRFCTKLSCHGKHCCVEPSVRFNGIIQWNKNGFFFEFETLK